MKQMRRTGNHDETKRIFMDLDVVLKSHDCKVNVLIVSNPSSIENVKFGMNKQFIFFHVMFNL